MINTGGTTKNSAIGAASLNVLLARCVLTEHYVY